LLLLDKVEEHIEENQQLKEALEILKNE